MDRHILSPRLLFTLIGVAEGLLWLAVDPYADNRFFENPEAALLFGASSAALVARYTWQGVATFRWAAVTAAIGALIAAITWHVTAQLPPPDALFRGDDGRTSVWSLCAFALLYIAVPFAQTFRPTEQPRFPYPRLFETSWNNFFIGLVAVLFFGAAQVLLAVWGELFAVIQIEFFKELFANNSFQYVSNGALFGFGLSIGRDNERVIRTLRGITLMMAHALLPVIALVAVLFVLALLITGMDLLWSTGSATPLVLSLSGLFALALNAVLEEGDGPPPYPRVVRLLVQIAGLTLPIYVGIAAQGANLRISQHGLTPERVHAVLITAVMAFYAIGYAAASLRSFLSAGVWMGAVRSVNVATACVAAALLVLVQLNALDPLRLSAANQTARLLSGRVAVDDFDFAALRFEFGHYGWAALEQLESLQQHPEHSKIAAAISEVRAADDALDLRGDTAERRALQGKLVFTTVPPSLEVPSEVLASYARRIARRDPAVCKDQRDCILFGVDIDDDGALEFCFYAGEHASQSACFDDAERGHSEIGWLDYYGTDQPKSPRELSDFYQREELQTAPARLRDIVVSGGVLRLRRTP